MGDTLMAQQLREQDVPWNEVDTMELRKQLIESWLTRRFTVRELAESFGISAKTAYKWLGRFREIGGEGLADRSRARLTQPDRVGEEVREALLACKAAHRHWGPRKVLAALGRERPEVAWPAASTIGSIYKQEGLVQSRRRRPEGASMSAPWQEAQGENDVWAIDFKGQWRLGDGQYCFPLTLSDSHTRYLLVCHGLPSVHGRPVREAMERAFREYGLPLAIRSDNGVPFAASCGTLGLSELSVWWLRLGIRLQRIRPGSPQQNGRHERIHRTLKQETVVPVSRSMAQQQSRFEAFRQEYNQVRPHSALGMSRPADLYRKSPRAYPERLSEIEYPSHFECRKVSSAGEIRWRSKAVFVSNALAGQVVGLEQREQGWKLYFGANALAFIEDETLTLRRIH